jgi:hypothetical protein
VTNSTQGVSTCEHYNEANLKGLKEYSLMDPENECNIANAQTDPTTPIHNAAKTTERLECSKEKGDREGKMRGEFPI